MNRAPRPGPRRPAGQHGALLIEVLVAIVICAFGLLGFVAMQARASAAEFESYQRSQALVLLEDIANRLNANRANAGDYVAAGLYGNGAVEDCTGLAGSALDLCEWANLIRGSAEERAGSKVGAMLSARGCIARAAGTSDRYVVSIAWSGLQATGAPAGDCGKDDPTFPTEALRRVVSTTVCVAQLRDPDVPPAVSRC